MTMKRSNEYANGFGREYARIPKAVFAAVAYSYANWACGQEASDNAVIVARFMQEWQTLYDNGLVPQKPAKHPSPETV